MAAKQHYSTHEIVRSSHRRKSFWQIWVPLVISLLLAVAAAVFIVMLTFQPLQTKFSNHWMSVSVVYLIFPALFIAFLFIVILAALVFLLALIYRKLPPVMDKILTFMHQANEFIDIGSDKTASPVIAVQAVLAGFQMLLKRISLKR
jgi:uncharacterized BrkB/YihY/UPF0761 family membrane protein